MTPTSNSPMEGNPSIDGPDAKSPGEKAADAASQLKNKVNDFGRTAAEKVDQTRTAAASGLDTTASALHQSGEKVTSLAHATADKLSNTAEYLRNHDVKSMMNDVEQVVKKNPGPSLLAAGVIGFLVGRSLRRSE